MFKKIIFPITAAAALAASVIIPVQPENDPPVKYGITEQESRSAAETESFQSGSSQSGTQTGSQNSLPDAAGPDGSSGNSGSVSGNETSRGSAKLPDKYYINSAAASSEKNSFKTASSSSASGVSSRRDQQKTKVSSQIKPNLPPVSSKTSSGITFPLPAPSEPAFETSSKKISSQTSQNNSSYAEQVAGLVNKERKANGLSPLSVNSSAKTAAQVRAKEIEKSFSHTRPDGSSFSTALKEQGVSYRRSGENIAWGQKTPKQVMEGWMNSPGHRANILNPNFTAIGIGHYKSASGKNYWTQLFIG